MNHGFFSIKAERASGLVRQFTLWSFVAVRRALWKVEGDCWWPVWKEIRNCSVFVVLRWWFTSYTDKVYIKDLLKVEMAGASAQKVPMSSGLRLSATGSKVFADPQKYRSIVGALHYVTITRPDLSFSVNKVCQFMHEPKLVHRQAVKKILRSSRASCV
ncbi:Retrovirus-related Pol polyprotein from transposon TNT 1-94 [Senna tora]|uniref:Retrovirus-related Pol polyprotein from transposon TNT 1-94 n=1 Tax=Senna tora TaxID=362788 RepID=A0A834SSB0_9FABA|nr:Retrovirus-related Pol polyprotein from transposon TNT 1-94 [Senna tora]